MTFYDLERRLLALLNQKVRRGEISQRQLARRTGFTQPHIHNVLKGARRLHTELADAALQSLELSVTDLLDPGEVYHKVPLWRGSVGPHSPFPSEVSDSAQLLFSASFLSRFSGFIRPMLVRLAADEEGMSPLLDPGDLVLLDRSEAARRRPVFERIYALSFQGHGAVCRCQRVGAALALVAENNRRSSRLPDHLPLRKRNITEIVQGRVVWACREFDVVFDG